ncbi:MAG: tRNA threonylcarbamoyladenosine dehydratase [Halothiobacillus sp.]
MTDHPDECLDECPAERPAEKLDERTELLIGAEGIATLRAARVLVAGLGGVGGACAESLVRAGVGTVLLLDHDQCGRSNLNRQLLCTEALIGQSKAEVAVARFAAIRQDITTIPLPFFLQESGVPDLLNQYPLDAIADCIDSIGVKAVLLAEARLRGIVTMTALGAGNRLDPRAIRVGTLGEVQGCGLARVLRSRLRRLDCDLDLPAVYSTELPQKPAPHIPTDTGIRPRAVNGTISYMPNIFGHIVAGEIIRGLLARG